MIGTTNAFGVAYLYGRGSTQVAGPECTGKRIAANTGRYQTTIDIDPHIIIIIWHRKAIDTTRETLPFAGYRVVICTDNPARKTRSA
jgi:hypothetical protein